MTSIVGSKTGTQQPTFKSAGPDRMYPSILKELTNIISESLAILLEDS